MFPLAPPSFVVREFISTLLRDWLVARCAIQAKKAGRHGGGRGCHCATRRAIPLSARPERDPGNS